MMQRLLCQQWEESERGWGTRPDGHSLHKSEADRRQYIEDYWSSMPDEAPDEYSRPCGEPYWRDVDDETFKKVMESTNGVREFRASYPGNGASNGCATVGLNRSIKS